MSVLRTSALASAAVLMMAMSGCSDGGISEEAVLSSNTESMVVAQGAQAPGESSSESQAAAGDAQVAGSVAEKAVAQRTALPPSISGKLVAAALSVNLNPVAPQLKTAYLGGNPAASAVQIGGILANNVYMSSSNGIIPNNQTPYSCCLAGYPSHSMRAMYSYVTGGLTLSREISVWTATSPRDPAMPTVMVRQGGDLAFKDDERVLLNTTHASWNGPSSTFVQLQVASDTDPTSFRVCWHISAPSVRRLSCGVFSRASAAFRGSYVIDDSMGTGARTFKPAA